MKKIIIILIVIISGLFGCSEEDITKKFELSKGYFTIEVGEYIVLETNANDVNVENLVWETNSDIVSVDNGIVLGNKPGIASVSVTLGKNYAEAKITVVKGSNVGIEITGSQSINIGEKTQLSYINNDQTPIIDLKWISSNTNIANVNNGLVTGINSGLVTISLVSQNGKTIYDEYLIYVQKDTPQIDQIVNTIHRSIYEIYGELNLTELSNKIIDSINNVGDAFVGVSNYVYVNNVLNLNSIGSGVIYNRVDNEKTYTYRMLTNQHVIDNSDKLNVYLGYLNIEAEYAKVIKSDASLDLAILEFDSIILIDPIKFTSKDIIIGEFVIAIGNPKGFEYFGSATFGIVSHPSRMMSAEENLIFNKYIQHDAAINSGNSGGPLVNIDGELVGINTLKMVNTSIEGMGFAIPIDVIIEFVK